MLKEKIIFDGIYGELVLLLVYKYRYFGIKEVIIWEWVLKVYIGIYGGLVV